MKKALLFLLLTVLVTALPFIAISATINVPGDQASIQAGLNTAASGDTVLVAPGTYTENITWPAVNGIKLLSSGDASNTIIDGSNTMSPVLLFSSGVIDTNTVVFGFTIQNGTDNGGGGIACLSSSPKLTDLVITSNEGGDGGAIYCSESSSVFRRLLIYGNEALNGGAVYLTASSPEFYNVTIYDNSATGNGNGIYIANSNPAASLFITQSNLPDSVTAIYNDGPMPVEIPFNWWGTGGIPVNGALVGGIIVPSFLSSPDPDAPIPPVQGFTLERLTGYSVQLSWTDDGLSDLDEYVIYYDNDASGAPYSNSLDQITTNEQTISGLTPNTTYYFTVIAKDTDGNESNYSDEKTANMKYVYSVPGDYANIQSALDGVGELDTVFVSTGIYYENLIWPETDKITLIGADSRTTIIDGSGSAPVLSIVDEELEIELEVSRFTIQNGSGSNGGGIDIDGVAYPNLNNLFVVNNHGGYGGGIFIRASMPTLSDIAIHGNTGSPYAGAIQNVYAYPTMNRITISDNTSDNYEGIYSSSGNVTINNSNLMNSGRKLQNADLSSTIDATNNYWDNAAGPQSGDVVGDFITTSPFLATPDTDAPVPPPTGLTVTRTSGTSFDLTWRQAEIEDFGWYTIYYDTDQSGVPYDNFVDVISGDTTYSLTGLSAGETYYFAVTTVDDAENESWYSVEVSAEATYILNVPTQYTTIQSALDAAFAGDSVLVAPGTYNEHIVWPSINDLTLTSSGDTSNTIIDGSGTGRVITMTSTSIDTNTVISRVKIKNGYVSTSSGYGGGINCKDSSPKFDEIQVEECEAWIGAGIFISSAQPVIRNSTISYNTAARTGGGLYANNGSTLSVSNSVFSNNTASSLGAGGLGTIATTLNIYDSVIRDNTSPYGAGVRVDHTTGSINGTIISGNQATEGGGISFQQSSNVTLNDVWLVENSASGKGGGFISNTSTVDGDGVLFSQNSAGTGGAIYITSSNVPIDNTTFEKNTASTSTPGIYVEDNLSDITISASNLVDSGAKVSNLNVSNNSAIGNWWGNASGPGDGEILGDLEIIPVLSSPSTTAPVISPSSISATRIASNEVEVDWNSSIVADFDHYMLYFGTSPGAPYADSINTGTTSAHTFSGLTYGQTYYFVVKNFDSDGNESLYSDEVSAEVKETLPVPSEFATIQAGLDIAADGDTVLVAPGTYTENITWPDVNGIILLASGDTTNTIIDGNASSPVINFSHASIDTNTVMSGFTLRNGNGQVGGGIYCNSSSPLLTNLSITGNNAGDGGGISFENSSSIVRNVTISNNDASSGGAINCNNSLITIVGSNFTGNTAAQNGGGLYCTTNTTMTITGGSISSNVSSINGGGLYCDASTLTLSNVTVDLNTAREDTLDSGSGGGIYCVNSSTLTINEGSVSSNTAPIHGGGIYCQDTTPTFDGVTVNNNEAGSNTQDPNGYGGGIWLSECTTPTLSNLTIDGNVGFLAGGIGVYASTATTISNVNITSNNASFRCGGLLLYSNSVTTFTGGSISNNASTGHGGGIYNYESPLQLIDVTMGFNVADSSGGAIYGAGTSSVTTVENSKIYRNEAVNGSAFYLADGTTELDRVAVEGNITNTVGNPAIYIDSGASFEMNQSSMVYNNNGAFVEADDLKGIYYDDSTGTSCTINLSNILNKYGAIEANGSSAIDARFNWWGDPSGAGSLVTGTNVDTDGPLEVVLPNTPIIPPSNVSVASTTDESITISWDALPLTDLAGYKVYIWDAADYQPAGDHGSGLDIGNVTIHTFTGLTLGANYSMAVTAYDNDSNESWYSAYLATGTYIPLVVPDNYATIQAALNAATAGDTVLVNPGTYVENINWPAVNGIKLFSTGDSSNTIIDGDLSGNVLTLNQSVLDTLTEISGFTLTNGLRGIYIKNCSAKFDHLHVCYNNSSTSSSYDERGVGVYADNSHSIFTNMDISHNEVKTDGRAPYYGFGSGLYAVYGNNVVRNTIIAYNKSRDGAGIYFDYGVLTLEHCVIYKNGGAAYGSGLWSSYKTSVLNMVDVKFVDNYATTSQGFCVIYHSNYWDNQAPWTFNNVTLYDSDSFPSSAIEMYGPAMDIENCYVEGGGPGIASDQDNMVINNCNLVSDWKVVCVYGDNWDLTDNWWGGVDGDLQQSMQILNWGSYNRHPHLTIPAPDAGIPVIKGLTADNITGSSMVLSWDASLIPDLAGYKIYYDTRDIEEYYYTGCLDVGNTTSYTFDGLTPGESYYFTVVAYDTDDYESWYAAPVNPTMTTPLTRHVPGTYATIQEALNAAVNGDSIIVAGGGVYSENITWPHTYGIKLIGDPNNKPVIEGDGTRWAFYMMGGTPVIDTNTVISGFEITGGGGDSYDGAGLSIISSAPLLENLDIHHNNGTRSGGGLFIYNGSPTIRNSKIRDNYSDFGGGVYVGSNTSPIFENTTISGNRADMGGGIVIYDGSAILQDVLISENTSEQSGGGVYTYRTGSSFTDVQILNNRTDVYTYGMGAGVYAVQDTTTFERVSIVGNIANYQGAGMHITDGNSMTITHCTIANNMSPDGGDIWVHGDALGELSYSNLAGSCVKVLLVNNAQVNAVNNWWGDPSGPQTGDLAGIVGNPVPFYSTGTINYTPFLTEPDIIAPPIPLFELTVTDSSSTYIDLAWEASPISDVAGYKVQTCNDTIIDVGNVTSFRDTEIESHGNDKLTWAQVLVYDADGNESVLSDTVKAVAMKCWVDSLRINDEAVDHVVSHTPTIKFRSDCDMPQLLIDYKIQVSSTTDFSSPDMWNLDWGNGGDIVYEDGYSQTVTYNGATPLDGETYYLRIKTRNNGYIYPYLESEWSDTLAFRMNSLPARPNAPFSPTNNAVVSGDTYLTAIASTDAEDDTLIYSFNIYSDEALSQEVRSVSDLNTPVWQVTPSLPDEATYYWTAKAWDGFEWSIPTNPLIFVVNNSVNTPEAFSLLTPDDVSTNITGIETLTWESTTDSDVGDTISYYVYLSKTSDFSAHVEVLFNAANTSLEVDDLVNGQTYYWKVKAQDTNSEGTWSTETWSFTVEIPGSPEAFALESPTNGAGLGSDTATLRWLASSDDDPGDAIHYEVQWAIEENFSVYDSASTTDTFYVLSDLEIVAEALLQRGGGFDREALDLTKKKLTGGSSTRMRGPGSSGPETGSMLDALPDDTVIYWRVKAVDTQDHDTWAFPGMPGWSFTTGYAEAPAPFSLVGPANNSICSSGDTTLVWRSTTDNDPNDTIEYRVFIATDSGFSQNLETHVSSDTTLSITNLEDNTEYFWKVKAIDNNSDGTWSNEVWSIIVNIPENPDAFTLLLPLNFDYVPYDTVEVEWSEATDVDPGDVITYQLEWANNPDFEDYDSLQTYDTFAEIEDLEEWNPEPTAGSGSSFNERSFNNERGGSALDAIPDDTPVWWRVKAIDQYGNMTWAQPGPEGFAFMVDMPEEPEPFSLLSPADGSTCLSGDTTLVWNSTIDPDPYDEIMYVVVAASDDQFTENVESMYTPDTTIMISDRSEGSTLYWKVMAQDENTGGTWSNESWQLNFHQTGAPYPFDLLSPADEYVSSSKDVELAWDSTTDPDPLDVVSYVIYLSTDSEFTSVDSVEVTGTTYTATNLLDDTTYWWKVRAKDNTEKGTWSNQTLTFSIDVSESPEAFALTSPSNGTIIAADTVQVNWSPSSDVDPGDNLTYTIQWSIDADFTDYEIATTSDTFYVMTDLTTVGGDAFGGTSGFGNRSIGSGRSGSALDAIPDDTTIYWRVFVKDDNNNIRWAFPGESGWSFSVELDEMPLLFSLIGPADGSTCSTGDTTLVWNSTTDADPGDVIGYIIYVSTDAAFTSVDSIEVADTTYTASNLLDDTTYWWKVRAQDSNSPGTWSTETWSFDVAIPDAPELFALYSPPNYSTVVQDTVQLSWYPANDVDPGDVVTYTVEWATNSSYIDMYSATTTNNYYLLTDLDMTVGESTGRQTGFSDNQFSGESAGSALDALPDDTIIYWRVKATDQYDNTSYAVPGTQGFAFMVWVPEAPSVFSLLSPSDGSICLDGDTTLVWESSVEPDVSDDLTYVLYTASDAAFTTNVDSSITTDTTYAVYDIPESSTLYWKVRAQDENTNGTWSTESWSFDVYQTGAPLPFSLLTPADGSTCTTGDMALTWESTTDADPGDVIGYVLYLSTDVDFTSVDSIEVADTSYTTTNLLDDTQYWWKVRAQDTNSIGTWSDETWSFDVDIPDGPESFTLLSPSNEAVFTVDNVTVKWSASSDVDPGDEITYELQYSLFEDFSDLTSVTTSDTTVNLTDLADDMTYYWRVKAVDIDDNYRWAMPDENGWSFSINIPEIPEVFSLVSPGNGSVCVSGDTTLVWNVTTDPDPADAISYVVYTAYDENFTIELDSLFTTDTSIVLSDLSAGSSLYWKVRAQDTNTSGTWSAESWYFDLYLTGSPDAFSLVTPDSGSVNTTDYITLQWSESFDDDPGDILSYILYLATDSEFTSIDSIEVITTSYEVTNLVDDTTYWWKVRAQDSNSLGTWSNETWSFDVDISEGPESFTLLSPSNEAVFAIDNVQVRWSSSSDVDPGDEITYELEYALETDFSDLVSITTSDTTADLTDLADDLTYFWRVKAIDGDGNYRYAIQGLSGWSFCIDIPEVPDAFSLAGPSDGSVNITGDTTLVWNTATDPDPNEGIVYVVYLAQDAAFTAADSFAMQDTTYTLHNLVDDTNYWWKVRAQDTNTTGTWSTETWSFSVNKPNIPEPFSMLSPGDESIFGCDSVRVKWSSSSDADPGDVISYELHVSEVSDFSNFNTITLSDTLFDLTALNDDQAYYWRVKAIDSDGNFRWAMPGNIGWSFDIAIPEVPNTFSLIGPVDGSVNTTGDTTLVWHSTSDPDPNDPLLHVVYLSQDATFTTVDSFVVQDTTYQLDHLPDDTNYWWKVRAIDTNTNGTWSTETWSFSVDIPNIPEPFSMLSPGDESIFGRDSVRVKWSSSSDADPGDVIGYELHVSEVSDFSNFNTITLSDTLFDLTGLNDDQAYYWRVKAIDSDNNSRWAMPGNTGWSFDIAIPEVPNTFSLIGPVDTSVNFTGDTTLVWHQATDPDPYEGIVYVVYLAHDAAFTAADSFAMQDTTYTLHNLLDDTTYWWKVRAQDTNTAGTWSTETWSFDVNRPQIPEPFTMLAPVDGAIMIDDTVTVNWTSSSDLDPGDVLVYEIQWSSDPSFGNYLSDVTADTFYVLTDLEEVEGDSRSGSTGSNRKVLDDGAILGGVGLDELPDDTHIYWRVKVRDSYNLERWSQQGTNGWSFEIDMAEPPLPFSLVSPDNDWTNETNAVSLSWNTTSDPDPGDQVGYVIYLSTDEDFTEVDSTEVTGNTLTRHNLQDDTTYWWKVRAQDTNTTGTWSTETWSFDVAIPEAPEPFVQLAPTDGALITETTVLANWTHSSDNDPGDLLTYEIQWSSNPEFGDFGSATTADTFYTLDVLADDQTMYWRVKVTDSYDLATWSMAGSAGWSFEVDIPQPPLPFSLVAPDSAIVLDTLAATFEWEATTDPDPGDVVSYILSLSLAEDFRDTLTVHYTAESATSFPVPYMPDDSDYWWRVTASDQNGDFTLSDETWMFHTAWPEPPHPFELNDGGIDMNATGDSIVVTLTWHRTWDPDPESLEYYKVLIDTTDDMDIPIVLADSVTVQGTDSTVTWTKTYAPQDLPMLGETFWTVYAYDDNTDGTWADEPMAIFMTSVDETPWGNVPVEYEFAAAYPNPFNPTLTAVISLPHPSDLTVTVFNIMGQRVATIAEGYYQEGFHSFVFNGKNMASGVYFIIANSPGKLNQVKKVVLMK